MSQSHKCPAQSEIWSCRPVSSVQDGSGILKQQNTRRLERKLTSAVLYYALIMILSSKYEDNVCRILMNYPIPGWCTDINVQPT